MTLNHSHTLTREPLNDVGMRPAPGSIGSEQREANGVCASVPEEAEPRIWKVMAMRRELRMGRYQVSIAELADALLASAALPSK